MNIKGKGQRLIPEELLKYLEALKNKYPDAVDLVEANPTLEGGEESLSSVLINGTKYAVGGGSEIHLYKHLLYLKDTADEVNGFIEIFTTDSTPFTNQRLFDKVKANGGSFQYIVSPYRPNGNAATVEIHGLGYNSAQDKWNIIALSYTSVTSTNPLPKYIEFRMNQENISITSEDIEQIF